MSSRCMFTHHILVAWSLLCSRFTIHFNFKSSYPDKTVLFFMPLKLERFPGGFLLCITQNLKNSKRPPSLWNHCTKNLLEFHWPIPVKLRHPEAHTRAVEEQPLQEVANLEVQYLNSQNHQRLQVLNRNWNLPSPEIIKEKIHQKENACMNLVDQLITQLEIQDTVIVQ